MEKERDRAIEKGYSSPIQPSKEMTDREFNKSLRFTINNIDYSSLWIGSHNEDFFIKCEKYLFELFFHLGLPLK